MTRGPNVIGINVKLFNLVFLTTTQKCKKAPYYVHSYIYLCLWLLLSGWLREKSKCVNMYSYNVRASCRDSLHNCMRFI